MVFNWQPSSHPGQETLHIRVTDQVSLETELFELVELYGGDGLELTA